MTNARFAVGRPVADCARHAANCRQLANPFQLQTLAGQGFAGMQAQLAVGKAANLPTDANPRGCSLFRVNPVGENSPSYYVGEGTAVPSALRGGLSGDRGSSGHPVGGTSILALDLGTQTGWALLSRDGAITSGSELFKPQRFEGAIGRPLGAVGKTEEPQLAEKLMERIDILARLLHDKPTPVKQKVRKALSELAAISYDSSPLYVFYDDNQNLYARAGTFPIRDEPFSLTTNCRNTAPIHVAAYKHYKGVPVSPPDIQGDDVQFDESPSRDPQAAKINARIVDLVARQGVAPGDITVLVADALHKAEYYAALRRLPLPKPATWLEEGVRGKSTVLIDTIQRFKGLESPIVILWGLDTIDLSQRQELLYVGMSRAKSLLVIVGRAATCAAFKAPMATPNCSTHGHPNCSRQDGMIMRGRRPWSDVRQPP